MHAAPLAARPDPPGPPGQALPRRALPRRALPRRALIGLLALALAALAWSWWRTAGYPLADVVEDLEWTAALLRGEHVLDSEATRPLGFQVLLMPLFGLGRLAAAVSGAPASMLVMYLARIYQLAATLLLVALTARFAARAAGELGARTAGLAAGGLLALNPLILRWGIEPISEVTTGIFVLLSAELILFADARTPARRGLLAGLALGAAALTAYKSIAIVAPVFLFGLLLGKRRGLSRLALVGGLALCLLAQSLADLAYHGAFGESLRIYALQNAGNIAPIWIRRVADLLDSQALRDAAFRLYEACREVHLLDYPRDVPMHQHIAEVTSLRPRTWYVTHAHEALTWPGLLLILAGLARALRRRAWALVVPAATVAFYVILMSYKGSKDFRLCLPILSFCAALGGFGAAGLAARGSLGRAAAGAALLGAAVLGPLAHAGVNQRQFAGYWRAMEYVNTAVASRPGEPARVAAAFHWAVFARAGRGVELIKLPRHLDGWERHAPEQRAESLAALAELDWFVAHLALVVNRAELCAALGQGFEVAAAFYRPRTEASPGPVLVFRRRGAGARGAWLLRAEPGGDPRARSAERGLGPALGFEGAAGLSFLGFELERLPGDGLGWITYHWHGARTDADLRFLARVTQGERTAWTNDHAPGHGFWPTSGWPAQGEGGLLLSEGYPVLAPWSGEAALWIGVEVPGQRPLRAVRPSDRRPVLELSPPGAPPSPEGWRTVEGGLVQVGAAPGG